MRGPEPWMNAAIDLVERGDHRLAQGHEPFIGSQRQRPVLRRMIPTPTTEASRREDQCSPGGQSRERPALAEPRCWHISCYSSRRGAAARFLRAVLPIVELP